MAYSLTVAGYTFQNPPEEYRKLARLSNSPQTHFSREASDFYQSDSQDLQFQVEGTLALDPPLGEPEDDLDELERLQEIAIEGGEVEVEFDPFFSGTCVIEDDPFRQQRGESSYEFTFTVNSESTDDTAYPARSPPSTGNTFELGSLDLGYDPDTVSQNYERDTEKVKRLQGIARSVDNAGLVPTVNVSGRIDGDGQAQLWQKARDNVQAYLSAEFQNGWCLIDTLSISNDPEAPDYLDGLFQYDLDVIIVKNPASGIGDVTSYVDQTVKNLGTYAGDSDSGDSEFTNLEFTVGGGTGSLDGEYIEWNQTTLTLSDNNTNYVFVDDDNADGYGTVKANQSAFPADAVELYRVEVSGGVITKVVDVREVLLKDREYEEGGSKESTQAGNIYLTVRGGNYEMNPGVESSWNDTRLLLQPNTTNYIWAEDPEADGTATVETNTTGYPGSSDFVQLYRAETDADSITNLIDDRPSDISDNNTDTSGADLNLSDDLSISDAGFSFERLLALADSLSISVAVDYLGLVDLGTDALSVADPAPSFTGQATLTETLSFDDGGTAITGGTSQESLANGSASDFDSATAEESVVHETDANRDLPGDGTVQQGFPSTAPGGTTTPLVYLPLDEDSGSTAFDVSGNGKNYSDQIAPNRGYSGGNLETTGYEFDDGPYIDRSDGDLVTSQWTFIFTIEHRADQTNNFERLVSHNENALEIAFGSGDAGGSDHLVMYDGDWDDYTSITLTSGERKTLALKHDGSDLYIYEDSGTPAVTDAGKGRATDSPQAIGDRWDNASEDIDCYLDDYIFYDSAIPDSEIGIIMDTLNNGSITLPWKTFAGDANVTSLELENVVATLNTQSLDVYVESDITGDGSVDETSDAISLDGSGGPFAISGLSTDNDKFRLRLEFSTTDPTQTAQFTSADLSATVGAGDDTDQNVNTQWEIFGARYDRSGNEYEGGGMVSRYGG